MGSDTAPSMGCANHGLGQSGAAGAARRATDDIKRRTRPAAVFRNRDGGGASQCRGLVWGRGRPPLLLAVMCAAALPGVRPVSGLGQDADSSQACGDEEQYVMFLIDASATTCVQNSNPDRSGWNCDDLQLALQYASQVRTKARPQPRGC